MCYSAKEGFPGGLDGNESTCHTGDSGSIPGLGRSSGEGTGNPLQFSCLENSMDRGVWPATVHGVSESDTAERLIHTFSRGMCLVTTYLSTCSVSPAQFGGGETEGKRNEVTYLRSRGH